MKPGRGIRPTETADIRPFQWWWDDGVIVGVFPNAASVADGGRGYCPARASAHQVMNPDEPENPSLHRSLLIGEEGNEDWHGWLVQGEFTTDHEVYDRERVRLGWPK